MAREFECKKEIVLPANPEDVWEAVATAAGNAGWLFPNEIPMDDANTIWDPPKHFAVRMENGDWFNALEYQIEGQDGGTTLLRYIHSGIFLDNWDTQFDAVSQHTDFYLHTLSQYLTYFLGKHATYIGGGPGGLQGPEQSNRAEGFIHLKRSLGLDDAIKTGDQVSLAPQGLAQFDGIVDYLQPNFFGVRTTNGLYRFFGRNAFGAPVGMSIHLFEEGVDAKAVSDAWQNWLNRIFTS